MRLALKLVLSLLSAGNAWALDPGVGDGGDGALVVRTAGRVVNQSAVLLDAVAPGAQRLRLSSAVATPGSLLLVWVTQLDANAPLEGPWPEVGQTEWVSVQAVIGEEAVLTEPLGLGFPRGAQVVRVPQYASVQVLDGGSLVAPGWNGGTGGLLAFLVAGELANDGVLSAVGRGFRGGIAVDDRTGTRACTGDREAGPSGGQAGEGVVAFDGGITGRAAWSSGGGGGVCVASGGGGGGHFSAGGQGGVTREAVPRPMGGHGGLALPHGGDRLVLGGGGGAGHAGLAYGTKAGSGGGAMWIRAQLVTGAGLFDASGTAGTSYPGYDNGLGGGGAGGTILLQATGALSCGQVRASGGDGGGGQQQGAPPFGTGGGGAGGMVLLSGQVQSCAAEVASGLAGRGGAGLTAAGAEPASPGDPRFMGAVFVPPFDGGLPVFPLPVDGGHGSVFLSRPDTFAWCGLPWVYDVKEPPRLSRAGATFSVEPVEGGQLPPRLNLDPQTGALSWRPSGRDVGPWSFTLLASWDDGEVAQQPIELVVNCDPPTALAVSCSAAPSVLLLAALALLRATRRAR